MHQNKEDKEQLKFNNKKIEQGFYKITKDITMLKNVLFKTVNEINKVKGFHCVLANILDECEIISKRDLYRLAKEKYSSALINEVKGFFETELPEVEENIIKQIQEYNKLGELLDGFEQMYFDSDGNPKIEA